METVKKCFKTLFARRSKNIVDQSLVPRDDRGKSELIVDDAGDTAGNAVRIDELVMS